MNKILSFIISFVLILTTITAATALNVDTYFENAESTIQLDPGQSTNYYIDIIPNNWATSVDVQATLYDQTSTLIAQKQVLFTDTHNSNAIYYSPILQLTQNDYLYSGDYFIEVKATQKNTDGTTTIRTQTLYFTITGERLFEIDFAFNPTNPFVGDEVSFVSQVNLEGNKVSSYQWLIDGNQVSTSKDFKHTFNNKGTYDVTLKVTDSQQRTKQLTKQVVVQQVQLTGPTADFAFTPSNPTSQDTISFVDQSSQGDGAITQYRWSVDGSQVSTSKNFNQKLAEGNYQVQLRVTDSNGLQDTKTRTVTVTQAQTPTGPTANFKFSPSNPTSDDTITFTSTSTSGDFPIVGQTWYIDGSWESLDSSFSKKLPAGTYKVRLSVADSNYGNDQITKTIIVTQAQTPTGPTADFAFSPSSPTSDDTITFSDKSTQGDNSITQYRWRIDGQTVSTSKNFNQKLAEGNYQVQLRVTDSIGLQDSKTKTVTVTKASLPQLVIDELGCNKNVVQGQIQHCSVHVSSQGQNIANAQVTFKYQGSNQALGTCNTNNKGYCSINPTINLAKGTYTVYAEAEKTGYQPDNSKALTTSFKVWEERYEILNLKLYEDQYVTEKYTFYRANPMYASFSVKDLFTGQTISPNQDLVSEVFLRVNNQNELQFQKDTFTSSQYRYYLPSIPITDDFLGEGKVFSFVFNFNDDTAGQGSVVVNILNNPITFNPKSSYTLQTNEHVDIDLKQYVSDVETPLNEVEFTFQNTGGMQVTHLSNNVYRFKAPNFETTQTVQVSADDTDGSKVTRPVTFDVFELKGPTANFEFNPVQPHVDELVTITSTSTNGDAQITSYKWEIDSTPINQQTNQFAWTFAHEATFAVSLEVTDANGLSSQVTKQIQVSAAPLPQLLLEELGCNQNVVQGYNQYCTALVTSQGQPVENAQVEFILQDQTFGTCNTNNKGYCKIEPQVNLAKGTYTVYAEAKKTSYQPDNSKTLSTTFTVWEHRYDILDLKVFSDEFITQANTFYRSDPIYASFKIRDSFTGQLVTDNDLVKEVFLRVLNQNELQFQEHTHTSTEYRYYLPSIPISDDFLGEGKVFSFVFNFNDNTAGQDSVVVNVLNNDLQINLPGEIEISAGTTTDIDFKPFVTDVETSPEDILFSFNNLAPIQVEHLGNNVFRFTAPLAEFTQLVSVTANDLDGSEVTDQTTFVVKDTLGLLGPVAILKLPGSTYVQNTVTLDGSDSYPRSGQIVSYKFEITRLGEQVDTITSTQDKTNFEFTQKGKHQVTLTVTDDQGRTGSVTHSIDVGRNNPDIVVGDYEGLHISNIVVYGVDDGVLDIDEPYAVYATITNNRDERIENLRVKFEIPELGFKAYGSSFNLNPGQSMQRSVVGYLPFDEMDLYQDDFIVTVGVFGSGFSRNKYVPVDVGVY